MINCQSSANVSPSHPWVLLWAVAFPSSTSPAVEAVLRLISVYGNCSFMSKMHKIIHKDAIWSCRWKALHSFIVSPHIKVHLFGSHFTTWIMFYQRLDYVERTVGFSTFFEVDLLLLATKSGGPACCPHSATCKSVPVFRLSTHIHLFISHIFDTLIHIYLTDIISA